MAKIKEPRDTYDVKLPLSVRLPSTVVSDGNSRSLQLALSRTQMAELGPCESARYKLGRSTLVSSRLSTMSSADTVVVELPFLPTVARSGHETVCNREFS